LEFTWQVKKVPNTQVNLESFEVSAYLDRIDLLNETVEQIKKDFGESGIIIHFSGNKQTAYQELTNQILPFIEQLLKSNYSHLMQVLYKIDVPEILFKNSFDEDPADAPKKITELIVKRELQKVVIRNHFKKNSS